MMRWIFLLFVITGAAVVAAIKMLPWWAIPLLFIALAIGVVAFGKWGLARVLMLPFKAKGAVLRGAGVRVHSIERAGECYRLDVTISPRPPRGPFKLWEPGELLLVGPNAKANDPGSDDACEVKEVEVKHNGHFEPDEGLKYSGQQRVRLLLATSPGLRQLRFRYYLELFGRVSLP